MIKKKLSPKEKTSLKQEINDQITELLSSSLNPLKENLGEKKFNKRVKKAARLLSGGVKATVDKTAIAKKPAIKKEPTKTIVKETAKKSNASAPKKAVKNATKKEAKVISKKAAKVISKK